MPLTNEVRKLCGQCFSLLQRLSPSSSPRDLFLAVRSIYPFPAASIEFLHEDSRSVVNTYYEMPYRLAKKIVDIFPLDPLAPSLLLLPRGELALPRDFIRRSPVSLPRTPVESELYPPGYHITSPLMITIHDSDKIFPLKVSMNIFQSPDRLANQEEQVALHHLSLDIGAAVVALKLPLFTRVINSFGVQLSDYDDSHHLAYVILSVDGLRLLEASNAGLDVCIERCYTGYDLKLQARSGKGFYSKKTEGVLIIF